MRNKRTIRLFRYIYGNELVFFEITRHSYLPAKQSLHGVIKRSFLSLLSSSVPAADYFLFFPSSSLEYLPIPIYHQLPEQTALLHLDSEEPRRWQQFVRRNTLMSRFVA
ncbi:hypothetical protein BDQ12DRAFT_154521 [Crucibulum laeve]|uniref:Uncharacterized protein n=1 Tax=Crucibulum laeve TaxID=68775 RepID=A0A5C3LFB7_9AGAR|nr:hypothetical protein BDQ12DRAFT_154521 [Crucibulum laeve]